MTRNQNKTPTDNFFSLFSGGIKGVVGFDELFLTKYMELIHYTYMCMSTKSNLND